MSLVWNQCVLNCVKLLFKRIFNIIFPIIWVSLLLRAVILSQEDYTDDTIEKGAQLAFQLQQDKTKGEIYVAMEGEERQVVNTDEYKSWQCDKSRHESMKLKSDLGNEVYHKCLNLSNQVKRWTPEVTKTYPDDRKKNVFQNCILENKWIREISNTNVDNSQTIFYRNADSMFNFKREIDPKYKQYFDCLYKGKQAVKIIPNKCYWTNRFAENKHAVFLSFWNTIGPDIMYTYDFVLYSEVDSERKENSLWYLIAYLKMLAVNIDNPMTIVKYVEECSLYGEQLEKINRGLRYLETALLHLMTQVTFKSNLRVSSSYDSQPLHRTKTGQRRKEKIYMVMEGQPEQHDVTDKYKNWQSNASEDISDKFISDLGIELYNKCLKLSNQTELSTLHVSKTYIRNKIVFQNCILENKWNIEIATRNVERSSSLFLQNYESMFNFNRVIHIRYHRYVDCLYWTRYVVRQVPKNCYWQFLDSKDKVKEFWNFFDVIGPDLLYTFNFVLYSEVFSERKENSLWYLIAYLRIIAINLDNPLNIVKRVQSCPNFAPLLELLEERLLALEVLTTKLINKNAVKSAKTEKKRLRSLLPV